MNTRDKILQEALLLFSTKGYKSVNMKQIAQAAGIKAPSLYNHFPGKQELFDAIIDALSLQYQAQAQGMGLTWQDIGADAQAFLGVGAQQLVDMAQGLFGYLLHDQHAAALRRMLTLSQYENQHLADLLTKLYQTDPLNYLRQLFGVMFKGSTHTPETLAMVFYAPLYLLLIRCDREPAFEPQAREDLAAHLHHFVKTYVPAPET